MLSLDTENCVNEVIAQLFGFAVISGLVLNTWISQGGLGGGLGNGSETGSSITLNR